MKRQPKIKTLIWAFFLTFSYSVYSQSSYYDYSSSDKTYVFKEDFDASSTYWETDEPGTRSATLVGGKLVFKSLNNRTQVKYRTISMDWEDDWELEIGVRWVSGKETSAVDFIWSKDVGNSRKFHFGFTAERKYVLAEYTGEEYDHIVDFTPSTSVNKTSQNRMVVRKVGQWYYFFVNARLVKTMAYRPVVGDMIGFTVPPGTTIEVDYLYASQLNEEEEETTLVTADESGPAEYSSYSGTDKTQVFREDFSKPDSEWETYASGSRMGKIHNGFFDWISMNDQAQAKYTTISGMNWSRDWQLEIRMKRLEGKETSSNDLIWDRSTDKTDRYHFGFTGSGKYNLSTYDGSYDAIVGFTPSSIVGKDTFNKITVRKVRSTYYFFFNERFIKSTSYSPVDGNQVGFMVPPESTLQVDYIDLSYLSGSSSISYTTTTSTTNKFVGVMTKNDGYSLQKWRTRDNFPKDEIKAEWDNDYYISDLSYDNDKWTLVMSKGTGYTNQRWRTRYDFPQDEIKELWAEDYEISELTYGNGIWALVMSRNTGLEGQKWSTRTSFPEERIKELRNEGLWISELVYGDGKWAVVASRNSKISAQRWFKTDEFPEDKIDSYLNLGYTISQLSHENDSWILLLSKYNNGISQKWFTDTSFPKGEISKNWDAGYYLTDLSYGPQTEVKRTPSISNNITGLDQLLVGTWYGGDDVGSDNGYMIFAADHNTTLITNSDTIGGRNYIVEGIRIEMEYEVDESSSPAKFDIVFKYEGDDYGSLKGIIKFIDRNKFQLKLATEMNEPRPTNFKDEASSKVATFVRRN